MQKRGLRIEIIHLADLSGGAAALIGRKPATLMIASRSVLRADIVWRIASTHSTLSLTRHNEHVQGLCSNHVLNRHKNMGRGKKALHSDNTKKLKTTDLIWGTVSSQASADVVEGNVNVVDGSEGTNMECGTSGCVSDVQDAIKEYGKTLMHSESAANPVVASYCKLDEAWLTNLMECSGKYAVSVKVGTSLMRFIKGKRGMTQKMLEEEMGIKIKFPSSKEEESVIIEGNSPEIVKRALEKVQVIVDEAVKSPNLNYSHFVSLPLAIHPNLVEKLINFQDSILGTVAAEDHSGDEANDQPDAEGKQEVVDESERDKVNNTDIPLTSCQPKGSKRPSVSDSLADLGVDKSIFIKPKTFHLTVLMLKLWNKDRLNEAANVLKGISSKVAEALDGRPVFVRLKGLETMRGSLAKAQVLYASVEEIGGEGRLLRACQVIIDAYVEAGLVLEKDAKQKLKLHATVMNTSHRRSKMRSRKFDSFDARSVVKEYGSEEWGEYLLGEAHLSQRFVFDENGYYHCCASIPLPGGNTQVE